MMGGNIFYDNLYRGYHLVVGYDLAMVGAAVRICLPAQHTITKGEL